MSSARNRDLRSLEQELDGRNYQELLWRITEREPFYKRFQNWRDVVAFMREGMSEDSAKDIVLRAIFRDYKCEPLLKTVLYVVFWPAITSIHYRKRHWNPDPEERWQDIQWIFLEVISRIDIEQRSERLVQKVYNSLFHRLYDKYSPTFKQKEFPVGPKIFERKVAVNPNLDKAIDLCRILSIRHREEREASCG